MKSPDETRTYSAQKTQSPATGSLFLLHMAGLLDFPGCLQALGKLSSPSHNQAQLLRPKTRHCTEQNIAFEIVQVFANDGDGC